ncbi:hypothetical protein [Rhizobium rhizogenes]|jgi:hypothetical protein|uniref:hypothetical protein n=1 Tax=Rhizobium rhizogenes TaxID=359 RepID=UPI0004D80E5C|nr:hypothetical protein [Rhizobium rhizogenes]KEA07496.1 hypothetical protein CN09_11365 [Rhizobium rhizogenes]NTJ22230.1 hypothetical protein [Rhizobium rhizogenes]QUE80949.1 hypothetical protein EML492_03820 [Rhizobium rhizogenes]TQO80945.1 hypothetical protein FFE80_07585 [Rhizobium rhizogenes]TRB51539.1 hypothetical protein EXN69_26470 [Rhizobium rhizogenes]
MNRAEAIEAHKRIQARLIANRKEQNNLIPGYRAGLFDLATIELRSAQLRAEVIELEAEFKAVSKFRPSI